MFRVLTVEEAMMELIAWDRLVANARELNLEMMRNMGMDVLKDAVLVDCPGPLGHGGSGGWERFEEFCGRRFGRPA